uniref:Radical SAM protein n=1 Tax=Bursaphelenchus xylophilus TaxID=6326 RepID=A0A1I7SB05_BURXY
MEKATDFSYPAHRLRGKPYQLGHFTSHDPRVFADIKLEYSYFGQYDAHIFHIKTKKLTMYLDNFILYDLPPMPHLVELECEFGTVGLMINNGALEFYGEIIQRLFAAAPSLNRIMLECGASVLGTFTELSEDRVADFFRVLESTLDLFSKHFEKMDVKLDFGVNLPHSLLDELDAKTELIAAIPVPMLFDYHPNDLHADYYLKMLNDLYYSKPDVPKHLLNKAIGFEIRFMEDVYFSWGDRLRVR